VPVVFVIAVLAVLVGVFYAATGRGGELAYEQTDHAPLDLGPVSAPDIALLRPPTALWGYNMQVTDEALDLVARAMRDRDVTIAYLQQELANRVAADPAPYQSPRAAKAPGVLVAPLPHPATQPSVIAPSPEAEAHQPAPTLAGSYDVQGPQGAYDTHDWWAEQEEAAREEDARREAESGRTGTVPNPVITSAGEPDTSSAHNDPPATSSSPPDDDTIAEAEEQGW
jgi:hypothetical protein